MKDKPEKICGYEVHPAAQLFPMLPEPELKKLAADIKKNGLVYPVIMCEKMILDGRNRLLACEMAGVGVHFRDYQTYKSEHSPVEYVMAMNLHRRQLTPGQRATAAVALEKLRAKEAKERQRMGKAKVPEGEKGAAREQAAKAMKVSARYVQDAKKLQKHSPQLFDEVSAGKKTLPQAMKEINTDRAAWELSKIPTPADHHPDDDDSDNLSSVKRYWRKANKKDRAAFWKWVIYDTGKTGGLVTFRQTCALIRERIETMPNFPLLCEQPGFDAVNRLVWALTDKVGLKCGVAKCGKATKQIFWRCAAHASKKSL